MKYKIAYCTPSLYLSGGIERVLTTKVNYFADKLDYDIYIILTDGKNKRPYYTLSDKIHLIQLNINFEELWNKPFFEKILLYLLKQIKYKKKLKKILFDIHPNITISLLRREINFITTINDGSYKIGEMHINKDNFRNFEEKDINFIKNIFSKIWRHSLVKHIKKLDKFVVLSNEDKKKWTNLDNVCTIANPIFYFPEEKNFLINKKVIAVGRYTYQKGFDLLINAWLIVNKKYPDWELNIYGSGDREKYQKIINLLGIQKSCHLNDAVNNINDKYAESSIFVLSSRFEGFGMVIIEAMTFGIPIVSFACPCGPKDIIKNGEDGFLVENGNITQLSEKICYLIKHSDERKKMGKKARENVKRFDKEKIMQQWIDLFNELTKEKE